MAEQITITVPDGTTRKLRLFGLGIKGQPSPEDILKQLALTAVETVRNSLTIATAEFADTPEGREWRNKSRGHH